MDGVDAGWHADPSGRHEYRYWDGSAWTDQASDNGVPLLDPLTAPTPEAATALAAPKRKSVGAIAAIAGASFLGLLVVLAAIGATSKPKSDGAKPSVVAAPSTTLEGTENTEAPTTTTTAEPTTTTEAPSTTTTVAPTTTTPPAPPTTSAPVTAAPRVTSPPATAAPRVTSPPATAAPVTAAPVTTANSGVFYANCTDARAAGVTPLYRGQPGYRDALDRDHDGVACE